MSISHAMIMTNDLSHRINHAYIYKQWSIINHAYIYKPMTYHIAFRMLYNCRRINHAYIYINNLEFESPPLIELGFTT